MELQKKIEAWMAKQEAKLKAEEGRIARYPRTTIMLFILGIAFAFLIAFAWQTIFPPPVEPAPLMTVFGFFDFLLRLQLPAVAWAVVFLFLWLTKW